MSFISFCGSIGPGLIHLCGLILRSDIPDIQRCRLPRFFLPKNGWCIPSLWKNMEKHGKTWKNMETHGKTWKNMEKHGKTWKNMEKHGTSMELYSQFISTYGHLWLYIMVFDGGCDAENDTDKMINHEICGGIPCLQTNPGFLQIFSLQLCSSALNLWTLATNFATDAMLHGSIVERDSVGSMSTSSTFGAGESVESGQQRGQRYNWHEHFMWTFHEHILKTDMKWLSVFAQNPQFLQVFSRLGWCWSQAHGVDFQK